MSFELTARQLEAQELLKQKSGFRYVLLRGGSRSGKTFLDMKTLVGRALKAPASRHCALRFRYNSCRNSLMKQTLPEVMDKCWPGMPYELNKADSIMTIPNGSELWFGGLDDKERVEKILGQEYATLYFNEISEIPYASVVIALTRLAQVNDNIEQLALFDCNPPPQSHWSYRLFRELRDPISGDAVKRPELYAEMRMNPVDNAENLSVDYIQSLEDLPERQRKRFYEGEWGSDNPFALWKQEWIDLQRIPFVGSGSVNSSVLEGRQAFIISRGIIRVVVAIDPPVTSGDNADECGMVVGGIDKEGQFYVIADLTTQGLTPDAWARIAVQAYRDYGADRIVAEVNNGGELVESVLRKVDENAPYRAVRASRGKVTRAEPISALYENGRVHHLGTLEVLEGQMTDFTSDFDPKAAGYSPDRVDALVWCLTDLAEMGAPIDLERDMVTPTVDAPEAPWAI